jgi:Asp-tRNA(Asn)/Glu-tRNA(Gln) amidotransferase A subunit family amidase
MLLIHQTCPLRWALQYTRDISRALMHPLLAFSEPLGLSFSVRSRHKFFRFKSNMAGKTTTTEFCVANSGPNTTNPHDPNRTPGGSSCGSAAAVADFQVPLALGAQTGGSIIRPASFTGVFALKPTYNAVSPEGTKVFSFAFDTLGFLTRSVDDLQLLADVFALTDDEPVQNIPLEEASVALIKTPMWDCAGPGTIAAMEKAERILRDNGVKVEEVSFPAPLNNSDRLKRLQKVIISSDAKIAFLREYRVDKHGLHPDIQGLVENSANFTHRETLQALDMLASMRTIVDDLAANYSAILTPSVIDEAPLGLENMGSPTFNTLWTASTPSFSLPSRFSLTWCRDSIRLSSTCPHSLGPMGCLSASLLSPADTAISTS